MKIAGIKLDALTLFWAYRKYTGKRKIALVAWAIDTTMGSKISRSREEQADRNIRNMMHVQVKLEKLLKEQCNE